MKIFYGFLIILVSVILLQLPISTAVGDYRTDQQTDTTYVVEPASGNATLVLRTALYDEDTSSVGIISDNPNDSPTLVSYNSTTRLVTITGLNTAVNRTLHVAYDVDALNGGSAISTLMDKLNWIWLLMIICFPPAALAAMFIQKFRSS